MWMSPVPVDAGGCLTQQLSQAVSRSSLISGTLSFPTGWALPFDAVRTQLKSKVHGPTLLSLQHLLWVLEIEDLKTLNFVSAPHSLVT